MASIIETAAGTFRALVRRKGSKTLCQTFNKRKDAERWARQVEADLEAGRVIQRAGGPTVGDAIKAYRELRETGRRDIAPGSNEHYMLEHLDRDFGDTPVAGLTPQRIAAFCKRRAEDGAGPYTVNMEVSKLGTALKYAAITLHAQWGDPVGGARPLLEHLGLIGPGQSRDRRPTPEELVRLKAKAPPMLADIIDFAIATCMRRGEIVRAEWRDVDEAAMLLTIRDRKHPRRKAGNHEVIPLLGDALAIIQRQPRTGERIFPVSAEWVSDAFLLACRVCEIENLHFHDMRHEATSRLFEAGLAIEQVALVTGHRSWNMLRRYTQLRPESLHQTVQSSPRLPAGHEAYHADADAKPKREVAKRNARCA